MKIHHVNHSGANRKYYLAVLDYINDNKSYGIEVTSSSLRQFISEGVPKGTDILSYQTFPDEYNKKKFSNRVISAADFYFNSFKGKKFIVDTHDCGHKDGFSRMPGSKNIPRVKCYPSQWFLENYNVIMISGVSGNPGIFRDNGKRTINVSCKFGRKRREFYGHSIREEVIKYLEESFEYCTNFDWVLDKNEYSRELVKTRIVVGAPGWGVHNASYWQALRAGALLFAHVSLNDIKLFPHSDLVDGEDFISYDLFNFKIKLERILSDEEEFNRIRNNGRQKFKEGLNHKKSADQLVRFLKE
jgi:hypothetical protein